MRVWIGRSWSEEQVGDPVSRSSASSFSIRDRLVGHVSARHHQRHADVVQQQVVQRRVGQHHAEFVASGAPPTERRRRPAGGGRSRSDARRARERRVSAGPARSRTIRANGRSSRCLRARSRATASSSSARHARWKPPMPLTATIAPSSRARTATSMPGVDARPAPRASVRLGMEAAVRRVVVLRQAGRAHGKAGHRRAGRSYGTPRHDREARAAVGAVDERVAVAAVGRVEQLEQAVGARGGVGRDGASGRRRGARADREAGPRSARPSRRAATRSTRAAARRAAAVRRTRDRLALDLDEHAERVVQHEAGERELGREPVDERAEADALHDARSTRARHPPHQLRSTW